MYEHWGLFSVNTIHTSYFNYDVDIDALKVQKLSR